MPFISEVMGKLNSEFNLSRAQRCLHFPRENQNFKNQFPSRLKALAESVAIDKSLDALIIGKSIQQLEASKVFCVPAISIDSNYFNYRVVLKSRCFKFACSTRWELFEKRSLSHQ